MKRAMVPAQTGSMAAEKRQELGGRQSDMVAFNYVFLELKMQRARQSLEIGRIFSCAFFIALAKSSSQTLNCPS